MSTARADITVLARYFEFYGGAADKVHGQTIPFQKDYSVQLIREPLGVTAHIIPWNYPAQMFGRSVAPALAMGNASVVKPAEDDCLRLGAKPADQPPGKRIGHSAVDAHAHRRRAHSRRHGFPAPGAADAAPR
ncbi:hypothetical protein G6F50_016021 [Rhizopus delemar]|uniref:Aldehyde dehydrogenase domain-containing protein n=1 Tax=Rhizopus delemar TaxID=936053 RepID=A0A9P7C2J6_9FUNG|nr:hypothetical protein G6F50_016021 [Rhizopus delemar]